VLPPLERRVKSKNRTARDPMKSTVVGHGIGASGRPEAAELHAISPVRPEPARHVLLRTDTTYSGRGGVLQADHGFDRPPLFDAAAATYRRTAMCGSLVGLR